MSLSCKLGFHDFIPSGLETVTYPKRGPFDPQNEEQRTWRWEMEICAMCGKKRQYEYPDYY